ncbi:myosin heavy chain, skeletal muscle-like [Ptychodera flava]|uniref:myosin heavy chain, skeletal muscle-like n=1 Tax=Ptychodera flava TaxID=63121 RepID=UPI00396A021C
MSSVQCDFECPGEDREASFCSSPRDGAIRELERAKLRCLHKKLIAYIEKVHAMKNEACAQTDSSCFVEHIETLEKEIREIYEKELERIRERHRFEKELSSEVESRLRKEFDVALFVIGKCALQHLEIEVKMHARKVEQKQNQVLVCKCQDDFENRMRQYKCMVESRYRQNMKELQEKIAEYSEELRKERMEKCLLKAEMGKKEELISSLRIEIRKLQCDNAKVEQAAIRQREELEEEIKKSASKLEEQRRLLIKKSTEMRICLDEPHLPEIDALKRLIAEEDAKHDPIKPYVQPPFRDAPPCEERQPIKSPLNLKPVGVVHDRAMTDFEAKITDIKERYDNRMRKLLLKLEKSRIDSQKDKISAEESSAEVVDLKNGKTLCRESNRVYILTALTHLYENLQTEYKLLRKQYQDEKAEYGMAEVKHMNCRERREAECKKLSVEKTEICQRFAEFKQNVSEKMARREIDVQKQVTVAGQEHLLRYQDDVYARMQHYHAKAEQRYGKSLDQLKHEYSEHSMYHKKASEEIRVLKTQNEDYVREVTCLERKMKNLHVQFDQCSEEMQKEKAEKCSLKIEIEKYKKEISSFQVKIRDLECHNHHLNQTIIQMRTTSSEEIKKLESKVEELRLEMIENCKKIGIGLEPPHLPEIAALKRLIADEDAKLQSIMMSNKSSSGVPSPNQKVPTTRNPSIIEPMNALPAADRGNN